MKYFPAVVTLTLCSLFAAGCVSTSTHQKSVDEAAALSSSLSALTADHQKLQNKEAACNKDLAETERRRAETQKQLEEKQLALERAQADIVRIEKVLSDRNQEAGRTMTQMRQELDRLTAELHKVTGERAQLIADRDRLAVEKEKREQELRAAQDTYGELIDKMRSEISRGEVTISELQGKLTVNLVEKILFDSGSAEIKNGGKEVLSKVGTILNDVKDKEIRVEGYSDNLPISPRLQSIYPSNWELSSARAISVVQFLRNTLDVPGERLCASGFAEFRPIADNSTPEGRSQNRRIQIILAPREAELVK
jgi:chemotaxis protein MotB